MKRFTFLSVIYVCGVFVIFPGCEGKLSGWGSSEKKYDSLFLGLSLGMPKKAFFDRCWELNKQKLITHGPTNTSVEYVLKGELDHTVMMRFYPTFYDEKVSEMPVTFSYEAWAPWNRQFSSDTLLVNMLGVFKKWYGDDFKLLNHPNMGTVYYKMDGKRRINLFIRDDQFVQAVFSDMRLEGEKKKASGKDAPK